jgi:hypothetical protein
LKNEVKNEIARSDRPTTLVRMIDLAVTIDNRLYERKMEQGGLYGTFSREKNQQPRTKHQWPEPMELDAAFRGTTRRGGNLSREEMERRKKKKLCFTCGASDHQARFHQKGKKPQTSKGWKKKGRTRQANWMGRGAYEVEKATRSSGQMREIAVVNKDDEDEEDNPRDYQQVLD